METSTSANTPQKSRTVYLWLGILIGTLGVHNFFAGRKKPAFIQLGLTIVFYSTFLQANLNENVGTALLAQAVLFLVWVWAFIEALTVKKDGKGIPFK